MDEVLAAARADAAASAAQLRMLVDGMVTYEEHEEAIESFFKCAEEAGYTRNPIPGAGLRPTRIGLIRAGPQSLTDQQFEEFHYAGKATTDACQADHLDAVDWFYGSQQTAPTTAELVDFYKFLRSCVAEAGKEATLIGWFAGYSNSQDEAIVITSAQRGRYYQCALDGEALTGFGPPPPTVVD